MDQRFTIINGGEDYAKEIPPATPATNPSTPSTPSTPETEKPNYWKEIEDFLNENKKSSTKELELNQLEESDLPFFKKTQYFTEIILKKAAEEPDKDYSRQILTLSFHYYALGLYIRAKELIPFVKKDYFPHKALGDITFSMSARNKAEEYARNNKPNMAKKYQIEARYFLSMLYLIPFLREEESLKNSPEFQEFLVKLGERPFVIQLAPFLGIV